MVDREALADAPLVPEPIAALATTGTPVLLTGTPAIGDVPTATSPTTAVWAAGGPGAPATALDVGAIVLLGGGAPAAGEVLTATAPGAASFQPVPAALVLSVFGRVGAVVAALNDYLASQIDNDSSVSGATVAAALDALAADLAALDSSDVANASGVAGATVTAALNALAASIPSVPVSSVFARVGAVVAAVGDYLSSQINNDSLVPGATVTLALNDLAASIAALSSNDIANASGIPGGTVTVALNTLGAAITALTSSNIANVSGVAGASVTAALNALAATTVALTSSNIANASGVAGASVTAALNALAATTAALTSSNIANVSGVAGATVTAALNALAASIAALVSGVSSVFGRAGAVVAVSGDYTSSQVTNASGVAGATTTAALDTLAAQMAALVTGVSSVFGRAGAVVAAVNDYTDAQIDNTSNVDAGAGSVRTALNTLYNALPSNPLNVLRPLLPYLGGTLLGVSGTAYFVYYGPIALAKLIRFVELFCVTNGLGAQTAEVALASSPIAPSGAGQNLTVLVADGTLDSLLAGTGMKRNTAGFNAGAGYNIAPAAGVVVQLWIGFREAMATTQATFGAIGADFGQGQALTVAGAAALAAGQVLAGATVSASAANSMMMMSARA